MFLSCVSTSMMCMNDTHTFTDVPTSPRTQEKTLAAMEEWRKNMQNAPVSDSTPYVTLTPILPEQTTDSEPNYVLTKKQKEKLSQLRHVTRVVPQQPKETQEDDELFKDSIVLSTDPKIAEAFKNSDPFNGVGGVPQSGLCILTEEMKATNQKISPSIKLTPAEILPLYGAATKDFLFCFLYGFIPNVVTNNTLKQKTWANVAGVTVSILDYHYASFIPKPFNNTRASINAGGYMCGAVTGTLTRAALNNTIIPLTAYAFRTGMKLFRK